MREKIKSLLLETSKLTLLTIMPLPQLEIKNHAEWLHDFLNRIFPIFRSTLWDKKASFKSVPITLKKRPFATLDGIQYEWWFHHLITKDSTLLPDREFCMPRAERIRFPRHYIDSVSWLNVWFRKKKNEDRYYISDSAFDYLVILGQRSNYIVLLSAFPIDSNGYKQKMLQEHRNFQISV